MSIKSELERMLRKLGDNNLADVIVFLFDTEEIEGDIGHKACLATDVESQLVLKSDQEALCKNISDMLKNETKISTLLKVAYVVDMSFYVSELKRLQQKYCG